MSKITGNEISPGTLINYEGGLWIAVKTQKVKPGKGGAYNQVELKNVTQGTKLNQRFRSDDAAARQRDDRLEEDSDLVTFECAPQVAFHVQPVERHVAHFRRVETEVVAAVFLDPVHRAVRARGQHALARRSIRSEDG